jgi:hypothetical protein
MTVDINEDSMYTKQFCKAEQCHMCISKGL